MHHASDSRTSNEWSHTDTFLAITADLLAEQKNEHFVAHVFATAPGTWGDVVTLCTNLPHIADRIARLNHALVTDPEVGHASPLYVVWLPHPATDDFVLIHFFLEAVFLTTTAIYNRRWFIESRQ